MAFRAAGRERLEALRTAGKDPAHSDAANELRGAKVARLQKEFRRWNAEHGEECDPEEFRRIILPLLQGVSLGTMAKATGLSEGYCSFIRRGMKIPHQRHWQSPSEFSRPKTAKQVEG